MKWILRILAAPIIIMLALSITLCGFLLKTSAFVFGLLGTVCGLLGFIILLTGATINGVIVLIIAFLISPLGLPMLAAWFLGRLQSLRYFIQGKIYG